MAQPPSFDPAAAWADMVQKWEHEINSWSGKVTESEQFGALLGQATKVQLGAQKIFGEQMESLLKQLNLPSKAQLEALSERLDAIEESLDRLRLSIEQAAAPAPTQAARPASRRTRKPPAPPA